MEATRGTLATAIIVMISSSGCFFEPFSVGDEGRVEYAYADGLLGCLFGCSAEEPMAEGAHALVSIVNTEDLPPFTVSSDEPDVAVFTQDGVGSSHVHAEALSPGTARIVVRDPTTGEVIDRLPIRVHTVARIEIDAQTEDQPLTYLEETRFSIRPTAYDEEGEELVGVGGLTYEVSPVVDEYHRPSFFGLEQIGDAFAAILVGHNQEVAEFETSGTGEGDLRITARSGATLRVPIAVVSVEDVTRVELDTDSERDDDGRIRVDADAWAGDREISSPACSWSIDPASGPLHFDHTERDAAWLISDVEGGSATVRCSIGSADDTLVVTF